jgi:hypothetical protein
MPVAAGLMRRTFFDLWVPWAPHLTMLIVTALVRSDRWKTSAGALE